MRKHLLPFLLMLVALPAWGATYHVRQTALGDGSGSSNANSMAIATFNALGSGGNVALLHGYFTTVPSPASNGTMAAPTTYRNGATNNSRDSVWFGTPSGTRIDFYLPGTSAARHVLYRDFTIRGRVYIGTNHAATTTSRIRMSNIRIIDGNFLAYRLDDCKFDSLHATNTSAHPYGQTMVFGAADKGADSVYYSSRDTVSNSTFSNLAAQSTSYATDDAAASFMWSGRDMVYESVRCSLITTNTYVADDPTYHLALTLRFSRVLQTVGGSMKNCTFYGYWTQGGAGVDEPMNWVFKDGVRGFTMNNVNVVVTGDGHIADANHEAYPYINFAQDETNGTSAQVCEDIGANVIRNCTFKNLTQSTHPIWWYTNGTDGDSIAYNTFVTGPYGTTEVNSYARGVHGSVDWAGSNNTVFDHNAFVTWYAGGPAFRMGNDYTAEQSIKWANNVFVNFGATAVASGAHFGRTAGWPDATYGPVGNDYNVYYVPLADSHAQIGWRDASAEQSAVPGAAAWSTLRGLTNDAHSIYGTCLFADTSRATFDAHPLAGSAIDFGGGVYAGPYAIESGVTTHDITASAGAHGSISPSGTVTVTDGDSQTFSFSPDPGYRIASVTVDGVIVGTPTSYTFPGNSAAHTIAVAFELDSYAIYSQAYPNGVISPSGTTTVATGNTQAYEITPDATYSVLDVLVDGSSVGAVTSYTFTNVRSVHSIEAYFKLSAHYTITATAGSGGSISPAGATSVASGGSQAYTIAANDGYQVSAVYVDGTSQGAVTTYTFTNVTAAHTISATFVRVASIIITSTNNAGGTISPYRSVAANGSASVIICPFPRYRILAVYVDGTYVGTQPGYTFRDVTSDHRIEATFDQSPLPGSGVSRRRR